MDPRRGEHLSPLFAAFLAWLLDLEPMTDPAIAGICIAGNSVLAATTGCLTSAPMGQAEVFS